MKWRRFITPKEQTRFAEGDWNVIDDRFGHKVKASDTTKQWDGFRSIGAQPRHEQDFIRAHKERIRTPWARPESSDVFVEQNATVTNGKFQNTDGWTLGASWDIAAGYATYTAGSTDTMYQSVGAISGKKYKVTFTVFNYQGTGSVTASLGTASGTARTGNGTYEEEITASGANSDRLTFTPASGAATFNIDNVMVIRTG